MALDRVLIKGTGEGLIITIGSGNWQTILEELSHQLNQRAAFFKGGRVTLAVGERLLSTEELETVGQLLTSQQMTLWAVEGRSEETRAAAQSLGLEVQTTSPAVSSAAVSTSGADETGLMATTTVRRTLRSGQSVEFPGHVVIMGDVNPGARVVAGGHIIVWGRLRGTAHAGVIAPKEAFICALELAPMQLIIGNVISRSPAGERPAHVTPEIAFVQDGQIIAEAWP
jgi:septum site-determining protein MinC